MENKKEKEEKILSVPELPKKIEEAINNKNLVIFIGAGVSRLKPYDCKGWDELARNLIKETTFDYLAKNYLTEILYKSGGCKKVITICYNHFVETKNKDAFFECMKDALNDKDEALKNTKQNKGIYQHIKNMGGIFVTTNADRHIDQIFDENNIVIEPNKFYDNLNTPKVNDTKNMKKLYKIHGCISKKESLVFTASQYFKQYNDTSFINFLNNLFKKYTILFVGYGLEEFELLDFLCQKGKTDSKEKRHFFLNGYFSNEKLLKDMEQKYFDDLGIELIPFCKDEKNYEQLNEIFKEWDKKQDDIEKTKMQPDDKEIKYK